MTNSEPFEQERGDRRAQTQPMPRQPSIMTNLLMTATIALISGVLGAIGYSHAFGTAPDNPRSSQSQAESGSKHESGVNTRSGAGSGAEAAQDSSPRASASSSMHGAGSTPETVELKQQIKNLNLKMDRLGEQVDRLQQLLSLAVPLLQRMTPKN